MQFLGKFGKIVCWRELVPTPRGNLGSTTSTASLPWVSVHVCPSAFQAQMVSMETYYGRQRSQMGFKYILLVKALSPCTQEGISVQCQSPVSQPVGRREIPVCWVPVLVRGWGADAWEWKSSQMGIAINRQTHTTELWHSLWKTCYDNWWCAFWRKLEIRNYNVVLKLCLLKWLYIDLLSIDWLFMDVSAGDNAEESITESLCTCHGLENKGQTTS